MSNDASPTEKEAIWKLLLEIRDDLKNTDDKLNKHLLDSYADREHLQFLCSQVSNLNKLIIKDNGKKSILSQLNNIDSEVKNLKETIVDIDKICRKNIELQTKILSKETTKKTSSVIIKSIAIIILTLPGVISFFMFI